MSNDFHMTSNPTLASFPGLPRFFFCSLVFLLLFFILNENRTVTHSLTSLEGEKWSDLIDYLVHWLSACSLLHCFSLHFIVSSPSFASFLSHSFLSLSPSYLPPPSFPTFSCYLFPFTDATAVINCTKEDYDGFKHHGDEEWSKDQVLELTAGDVITDVNLVCSSRWIVTTIHRAMCCRTAKLHVYSKMLY